MTLPKDFWEQLPLKTDAELYGMLAHQEDYLPEALSAAKAELGKRNLSSDRATQLETGVQTEKAAADCKAQERLGWPMRFLIFILCAGAAGAILAVYYESKGYKGKARDSWIAAGISLVAHLFIGLLSYAQR
jgi:hypothetical protein